MPVANVTMVDDTGAYAGSLEAIARNVVAAFDAWKVFLAPSVGSLEIEVHIVAPRDETLASGGPASLFGFDGEPLLLGGATIEWNTGVDPNGARPDIVIWLDADFETHSAINPLNGSAIPAGKVDLVSVMAHEIGHGLGFFGLRDEETYAPDDTHETPFDTLIDIVNGAPYFTGPNAMALYGGPVPLTEETLYHIGNSSGPGADLASDLMFYASRPGTIPISALDAAILADVGLATIFNDFLLGSGDFETMSGGRGDDVIFAYSGDDVVSGDEGEDYLRGGDGADRLLGGEDFDDINGNVGADTVLGGAGDDWTVGGKDNDLLSGDAGDDIVYGNLGADWCDGGDGADLVRGGQDDDRLFGQGGDDWLSGDRGNDTIVGGAGADIFHTFGDAGIDRITDFNRAEGDRVMLDPGATYSVAQSGADVVISMGGGGQMILAGVQMASLTEGWIIGA